MGIFPGAQGAGVFMTGHRAAARCPVERPFPEGAGDQAVFFRAARSTIILTRNAATTQLMEGRPTWM